MSDEKQYTRLINLLYNEIINMNAAAARRNF